MNNIKLDRIEDAIEDFRKGEFVIVVDDEDRENEGDLIIAAEKITPEKVNFMLKHARGVLCAPIPISRCKELELDVQVANNTSMLGTPFTVTVDLLEGCTTGVSAHDRAATIRALADPAAKASDFGRPGHINPLYAQDKGVLRRTGHTEAAVDLARLAGLYPAGALMEIMSEDGTMARLPELRRFADEHNLKLISINDLIAYRLKEESIVEKGEMVDMPTEHGHFKLIPFRQKSNGLEHVALVKGEWNDDEAVLVRVHSSCATGDIFGSYRCDCGPQLHKAMELIEKEGKYVIFDRRQKTNEDYYIVLLSPAMDILRRYNFRLPLLSNQRYNNYIKVAASYAHIGKELSSHAARHTFAVFALNNGVPIEVVSKMLGHTNIKTTQLYAKILNTEVEKGFDILESKLTGKPEP